MINQVSQAKKTDAMLKNATTNYLLWLIENGYSDSTYKQYELVLKHFTTFIVKKSVPWDAIFTLDTLVEFKKKRGLYHASKPVRGLSRYLFNQKIIQQPIIPPKEKLPEIYQQYIDYYIKVRHVNHLQILRTRNTLLAFNRYLKKNDIPIPRIKIEQIDDFLKHHNVKYAPITRQNQRSNLRGFLKYLYQEKKILKRNLAPLVVGAPIFGQSKPPKFFRPHEIQKLFKNNNLSTAKDIRTYAMLHLGYILGLRPKEISLIKLDDISFCRSEITIPSRKMENPTKFPLPEVTIKAIALYIIKARAKSDARTLFLELRAPYKRVSPGNISQVIGLYMRKMNITGSAYWLRHTYAQNLLEQQFSIYEIKEMLGHDKIQSSQNYISIQPKLMRKVLFDETL